MAYFDSERLSAQIIAVLNLSPNGLSASEITARCPASPEQQATSDTLRKLKRTQQVILQGKKWFLPHGVVPTRQALTDVTAASREVVSAKLQVDKATLRIAILRLLRHVLQNGPGFLHFYEIHEAIPASVTRHRLSQTLDLLISDGEVEHVADHQRTYKIRVNTAQSSLFDHLPEEAEKPAIPQAVALPMLPAQGEHSPAAVAAESSASEETGNSTPTEEEEAGSTAEGVVVVNADQETQDQECEASAEEQDLSAIDKAKLQRRTRSYLMRVRIRNRLR